MRQTFTDLQTLFLYNIGMAGSTDANTLDFFKRSLGLKYQLIFSEMDLYQTETTRTATTVSTQQFYHWPVGVYKADTATVTVGGLAYPLTIVQSQMAWDQMNLTLISSSAIPRFIFPRINDFGIWPIPQGAYTITLNYHLRDRNLTVADYTTGTVTVTNNSQTLTGSGTTFTPAMVGYWFQSTNDGYWYRISAYVSSTSLTLETSFEGTNGSAQAYRIGQTPELPEEMHTILADGTTADYFSGFRQDVGKATWWDNVFWTGNGNNNDRKSTDIKAGLIGAKTRYTKRGSGGLVVSQPYLSTDNTVLWGTTVS